MIIGGLDTATIAKNIERAADSQKKLWSKMFINLAFKLALWVRVSVIHYWTTVIFTFYQNATIIFKLPLPAQINQEVKKRTKFRFLIHLSRWRYR